MSFTVSGVLDMSSPAAKRSAYADVRARLEALLAGERDAIANLAQCAALIQQTVPGLNWAGFYLARGEELVLGPFQGKVACVRIPVGRGVCGTCAATREVQIVPDVHAFPGHIACDSASRSELVLPLTTAGELLGVLDLDSPEPGRFDAADAAGFAALVEVLLSGTDWTGLSRQASTARE
ncbi:GAF domain-containing protein [Verticiella sediminum]|uniref:GAF domain-containing protein n=1 Tax=Verticiella sediminum TaxID=1247510 RepID=A0A556AXQ7_9BURK|nr:GAF domain-containing protein [Verticiella sediminum]TSH97686.1 GAF domain-containing protein [Verticiella sediminum]